MGRDGLLIIFQNTHRLLSYIGLVLILLHSLLSIVFHVIEMIM